MEALGGLDDWGVWTRDSRSRFYDEREGRGGERKTRGKGTEGKDSERDRLGRGGGPEALPTGVRPPRGRPGVGARPTPPPSVSPLTVVAQARGVARAGPAPSRVGSRTVSVTGVPPLSLPSSRGRVDGRGRGVLAQDPGGRAAPGRERPSQGGGAMQRRRVSEAPSRTRDLPRPESAHGEGGPGWPRLGEDSGRPLS